MFSRLLARRTSRRRKELAVAIIEGDLTRKQAPRLYGLATRTVCKWAERYKKEGRESMMDRAAGAKPPRSTR